MCNIPKTEHVDFIKWFTFDINILLFVVLQSHIHHTRQYPQPHINCKALLNGPLSCTAYANCVLVKQRL